MRPHQTIVGDFSIRLRLDDLHFGLDGGDVDLWHDHRHLLCQLPVMFKSASLGTADVMSTELVVQTSAVGQGSHKAAVAAGQAPASCIEQKLQPTASSQGCPVVPIRLSDVEDRPPPGPPTCIAKTETEFVLSSRPQGRIHVQSHLCPSLTSCGWAWQRCGSGLLQDTEFGGKRCDRCRWVTDSSSSESSSTSSSGE